jgi:two-component system, cell cycle response regulator DivK
MTMAAVRGDSRRSLRNTVNPSSLGAMELTHKVLPTVIVMDRHLPDADGWEASRRLKRDPLTRSIPIIALSADSERSSVERSLEAGCDAFLGKPCTIEALVSTIERLLAEALTSSQARRRMEEGGEDDR